MSHLVAIYLLNESLQGGHPGRCEMAVLEEDPPAPVHGLPHHGLGTRPLSLPQGNGGQLLMELHLDITKWYSQFLLRSNLFFSPISDCTGLYFKVIIRYTSLMYIDCS